jgi:hypothetical protein
MSIDKETENWDFAFSGSQIHLPANSLSSQLNKRCRDRVSRCRPVLMGYHRSITLIASLFGRRDYVVGNMNMSDVVRSSSRLTHRILVYSGSTIGLTAL